MGQPSSREKNTVEGEKEETPKTIATQENTEKQPTGLLQRRDKNSGKPRRSFWVRFKTFTFEPPKKVIVEGNTIRLVPILPEPETAVVEKDIPATTEEFTADTAEVPIGKNEAESQTLIPPEELISPLPEAVLAEEPVKIKEESPVATEKLKKGMEKTRNRFWSRLKGLFSFKRGIDESTLEELEDILLGADIGAKSVQKLIHELREAWKSKMITETSQIRDFIKNKLKESLRSPQIDINYSHTSPTVILVVGVNGVGKTTAIAKLANIFIQDGKKVMVAASDTFRAAAVEQLDIWSKRIGAEIVKHQTGSDPAAVAYDALEASIARGIDVVIVDTAGRLHTHENLMNELSKIKRVISKRIPGAPHEVLMVLDATTGQNALSQARMFNQAVNVTGIFLAKLDGTAKGGFVFGMRNEINIPVKYIGLGEKADDIEKFDPDAFVNALFE